MSFVCSPRRAAAGLLGAGALLAAALLPAAPAAARALVSISVAPSTVRVGDTLTLTGRSAPSPPGTQLPDATYPDHAASVFVLRPGAGCPARPPLHDDAIVLGHSYYWAIRARGQPEPLELTIDRPSAVGVAKICTYLRGEVYGGQTVIAERGPTGSVRIAVNRRAWGELVVFRAGELRRRGDRVPVPIACTDDFYACRGTVRLRDRRTVLGEVPFTIAARRGGQPSVRLTEQGRALARARARRTVTVDLLLGRGVVLTRRVTLLR